MRTLKIIVITSLLLVIAGGTLWFLKGLLGGQNPAEDVDALYGETHSHHEEGHSLYGSQLRQYEGTVKILGVSLYGEGASHRLEKDDSLVAILKSDKVELSDYEGQEVQVQGLVRDTVQGGQKIMNVRTIEVVQENGVNTFNEIGYEFTFLYPSSWQLQKDADKASFTTKKDGEDVELMSVYQFEDVEEPFSVWLENRDQNLLFTSSQVKVGSVTGERRVITDGDQEIIKTYVQEGNNMYELRLTDTTDETTKNHYLAIVDGFNTVKEQEEQKEGTDGETDTSTDTEEPVTNSDENEEEIEEDPEEEASSESTGEEGESSSEVEEEAEVSSSLRDLEPLSEAEISKTLEKGFSPFDGRILSFDYPNNWYFSYLGDLKYGFTDEDTYKASGNEVEEEKSRIIIYMDASDGVQCAASEERTIQESEIIVCALEPGLESIIKKIATSVSKDE